MITATRFAQPLSDVLADVSILDRVNIEQSGASSLADVLSRLPGIEFIRNGGPTADTQLLMRGADTRMTAVYIDGVRIDSQYLSGGASWSMLPLSQIDRIEVLRGPAAAIYGSDAVAGVIQIFTRKGEGAFEPVISVGAGSYLTRKAEAGFSGSQDALNYSIAVAQDSSKGYNAKVASGANPDRDGYDRQSAHASFGLKLNAAQRLEATLLQSQLNTQYDGTGITIDHRAVRHLDVVGLNWISQWSPANSSRLSVSQSTDHYETQSNGNQASTAETTVRSYLWQNRHQLGNHEITWGFERREDTLFNKSTPSASPIQGDRAQNAVSLGYGSKLGAHLLQVNVRHDQDTEFGGQSTHNAAYAYALTPAWRATASVGTAFRVPTLYQRFSPYGLPTLVPEFSRNQEVGMRFSENGQRFSMTVYHNLIDNLISNAPGAGTCAFGSSCYTSTARALLKGTAFSGVIVMGATQLKGSLDLQSPQDLLTGNQLKQRARHHGVVGFDTLWSGWTLGAESQVASSRYNDAANTTPLPGYALFNLYASRQLQDAWSVLLRVDNLTDKSYQLASTYPMPGRVLFASLKWSPR